MAGEHSGEVTPVSGRERLAERLHMTDEELAQMSPDELEQASEKLKEMKASLDEIDRDGDE
jgi:hypothetical protein